jgi:hypothetical protein
MRIIKLLNSKHKSDKNKLYSLYHPLQKQTMNSYDIFLCQAVN